MSDIFNIPESDLYSGLEDLEPSEMPLSIATAEDGNDVVMYGHIPLTKILPEGVEVAVSDEDTNNAKDGIITLYWKTIEKGDKGGRLTAAHEIGHVLDKLLNPNDWGLYDEAKFRWKMDDSHYIDMPIEDRLKSFTNFFQFIQRIELAAWELGWPYAEIFNVDIQDWLKARDYSLWTYQSGHLGNLELILSFIDKELIGTKIPDWNIPFYSTEDEKFIDVPLKDLIGYPAEEKGKYHHEARGFGSEFTYRDFVAGIK